MSRRQRKLRHDRRRAHALRLDDRGPREMQARGREELEEKIARLLRAGRIRPLRGGLYATVHR